jgi:hypothetical protein
MIHFIADTGNVGETSSAWYYVRNVNNDEYIHLNSPGRNLRFNAARRRSVQLSALPTIPRTRTPATTFTPGRMEDNSAIATRPTSLEFYTVKASSIGADARRILKEYSEISDDEVEKHVDVIVCPVRSK